VIVLCTIASAWTAAAAHGETKTFGMTSVGTSRQVLTSNRKRANHYTLPTAGSVSRLSVYLEPTAYPGQQTIEGVIYADSGGRPGALLGSSGTLPFSSPQAAGWHELGLPRARELPAGNYWIGVMSGAISRVAGYRYENVAGAR